MVTSPSTAIWLAWLNGVLWWNDTKWLPFTATFHSWFSNRNKSSKLAPLANGNWPSRSSLPQPPPLLFVRTTTCAWYGSLNRTEKWRQISLDSLFKAPPFCKFTLNRPEWWGMWPCTWINLPGLAPRNGTANGTCGEWTSCGPWVYPFLLKRLTQYSNKSIAHF